MRPNLYELRAPATEAEWSAYHTIRKTCLFDVYHPWIPYDPNHPDERDPAHHPLGFFRNGVLVGTIRIDLKRDGRAIFRMVALAPSERGRHTGERLLGMAEDFARRMGAWKVCLNSVAQAIGFYRHYGYEAERWIGCTSCPTSVPVSKPLTSVPPFLQHGWRPALAA